MDKVIEYAIQIIIIPILLIGMGMSISTSARRMLDFFSYQTALLAIYVLFLIIRYPFGGTPNWDYLIGSVTLALIASSRSLIIRGVIGKAIREGEKISDKDSFKETREWVWYGRLIFPMNWMFVISLCLIMASFAGIHFGIRFALKDSLIIHREREASIALSLILMGFFTMIVRKDLMTQGIGLILSENGLLMSGIVLLKKKDFLFFSLGFLSFVLLTIFILWKMLGRIHSTFGSFEIEAVREKIMEESRG